MSQQQLVSSVERSSSENAAPTSGTSLPQTESEPDATSDESALYFPPTPGEYSPPDTVEQARKANYIAFLFRTPFAVDAYQLGYVTGIREDYKLQQAQYRNRNVPVVMMDNEFRNPDIDRYRDRFEEVTPKIAVFGDANTQAQARRYVSVAKKLRSEYPQMDPVIVPKCDCFDEIPDWIVLGRPAGGQCPEEDKPETFSSINDWRGRRVHILGGSPQVQWAEIQQLTQPTLGDDPPADIIGVDWNGPAKVAYQDPPEFWKRPTDRDPTHYDTDGSLSIREACKRSLIEIKAFWKERGVYRSNRHIWAS